MSDPKPVTVHFTGRGRVLFAEMIDMYLEGIEDAKNATIEDRSVDDVEKLLELCGGYDEAVDEMTYIKTQLEQE